MDGRTRLDIAAYFTAVDELYADMEPMVIDARTGRVITETAGHQT